MASGGKALEETLRRARALLDVLTERMRAGAKTVLAIDGRCGAGKTTLARALSLTREAAVIHMDDFYLPNSLRTPQRLSTPGANVHYERFLEEVAPGLRGKEPICHRRFDHATMQPGETVKVTPRQITIVEGSYCMCPELKDLYDVKVFLDISPQEQRGRILARNGLESYGQFITKWIPMEESYFNAYNVRELCDMTLWME